MKKRLRYFLAVAVATLFLACTTNKPEIILEAPEDGTEFYTGYDVHFVATLTDSYGLTSYSIQINGGDGAFHFDQTWALHNEKEIELHHHEIIIPENASPGHYLFTISCINKKRGKTKISRNIEIVPLPFFE